jgi:polysaccharide biosynthesis PFTS motif protein
VYSKFFSRAGNSLDLITTQSSLFKVPPAFKVINAPRRIMAWYSTNSKPIYASDDKIRKDFNVSALKDYVTEHWVWNQEEVDFLEYHGLTNVIPIGPVLFQDKKMGQKRSDKFVITYFDVTPLSGGDDFYSEKNTILILNTILRLTEALNSKYPGIAEIQVKPKRRYSKLHSKAYISQLMSSSKSQKIRKLSPSTNLFEVVSESDLVLAIPFTSPAILAKELNVKVFFVCIGIEGWDVASTSGGIPVIFQFEDLLHEVERQIQFKLKTDQRI